VQLGTVDEDELVDDRRRACHLRCIVGRRGRNLRG
jgi:hypothetical protein